MEAKHVSDIFQVKFRNLGSFYMVCDFDTKQEILGKKNCDKFTLKNFL